LTDASTKGLFPQLTDVLYALAESHAMLLSKVRGLRLEQPNSAPSVSHLMEASANRLIGLSEVLRLPELVDVKASPMLEASRTIPIDEAEPGVILISSVGSEFDRLPEATTKSDIEVQGADSRDTQLRSSTSEGEPTQGQIDTVGSAHAPNQPDPFDGAQSHAERAESEGRNYNYFDELDARLAGLGDQDPGQIAK
jgi:hypothetical protein